MLVNGEGEFKVVYMHTAMQAIKTLADRTAGSSLTQHLAEVLKVVHNRMVKDPLAWGDPQYNLKELGLIVLRGVYQSIHVSYAVDQKRRIVYVRDVRPWPGRELD